MKRFPYSLVFPSPMDEIRILAVAHTIAAPVIGAEESDLPEKAIKVNAASLAANNF